MAIILPLCAMLNLSGSGRENYFVMTAIANGRNIGIVVRATQDHAYMVIGLVNFT